MVSVRQFYSCLLLELEVLKADSWNKKDECKVGVIKDKVKPKTRADTKINWNPIICIFYSCCNKLLQISVQSLSLWKPVDCSTPGFPVLHHLLELAQIHVHGVGDAIQPSCPVLSPSPPAFNLSQHQDLFQ